MAEVIINVKKEENYHIISFYGNMIFTNIDLIKGKIQQLPYTTNAIIDLQHVNYIDCRGLGAFLLLAKQFHQYNRKLIFLITNSSVKTSFEIAGIQEKIPIVSSIEEAEKGLKQYLC